jgi:hypothetical protein
MRERAPQNQKAKIPRSCFLKAWARGGSSSVVYLDFLKIDHDYLGALQVRCSDLQNALPIQRSCRAGAMSYWPMPGFRTRDTASATCMNKLSCSGKSAVMLPTYDGPIVLSR